MGPGQLVETQIRSRGMRNLIRVDTVCILGIYKMNMPDTPWMKNGLVQFSRMGWKSSYMGYKHILKGLRTKLQAPMAILSVSLEQLAIWATSWENLFMPYANNEGTDQRAHPRSLISTFVVRCQDRIIPLVSLSKISSLYLAPVAAHAGLSLTWLQIPKTGFVVMGLIW